MSATTPEKLSELFLHDHSLTSHFIPHEEVLGDSDKRHNAGMGLMLPTLVVERQVNSYQEAPRNTGVVYLHPESPFSQACKVLIEEYQRKKAITQNNEQLKIQSFPEDIPHQPYLMDPMTTDIPSFSWDILPQKVHETREVLKNSGLTMAYMLGSASLLDPHASEIGRMVAQKGLATGTGGDGRNGLSNTMRSYLSAAREHGTPYSVIISTSQLKNQHPPSGYNEFIETKGMIPRIDAMWALAGDQGGLFALQGGMGTIQEILRFIENNLEVAEASRRKIAVVDLDHFHDGLRKFLTLLGLNDEVDWIENVDIFSKWLDSLSPSR